jgi:hypothetical protein
MRKPRPKSSNRTKTNSNYSNTDSSSNGYDNDHRRSGPRVNYQQMHDKYMALAREASGEGDRVGAEYNFQYADHYLRIIRERQRYFNERRQMNPTEDQNSEEGDSAQANNEEESITLEAVNEDSPASRNAVDAIIGELATTA